MERIVYTVKEVQELLGCGRSKVYELVEEAYVKETPFRVIKVGKNYLIPKEGFHKWLGM